VLFRKKRDDQKKNRAYELLEKETTKVITPSTTIIREKETVKETITIEEKVPCQFCGVLVKTSLEKCPHCGAPRRR
jgi:rubrerythrin